MIILILSLLLLVGCKTVAKKAYESVEDPAKYLPEVCDIGVGLGCTNFKITSNTISMDIQNGMGLGLEDFGVKAESCSMNGKVPLLGDGSMETIVLTDCNNVALEGYKFSTDLTISFLDSGRRVVKTGKITSSIEWFLNQNL